MASRMPIVFIAMVCVPAARGEVINGGAQPVSKPAEQLTPREPPPERAREKLKRPVAVPGEDQRAFLLPSIAEIPKQADNQGWRNIDGIAPSGTGVVSSQSHERTRADTSDLAESSDGSATIFQKKLEAKEADEADGTVVHIFMAVIGLGAIGLISWSFSDRKRFAKRRSDAVYF